MTPLPFRQPLFASRSAASARRAAMLLGLLAIVTACPTIALAQRQLTDIPDPDPELERAALQVADGFEINLFAADPKLAKPTQLAFDADGRLWVASSETYPQVKPGQQADDKILILTDSDGDGRADKTTVFARGLLIPTGVVPFGNGAYVANSTELVFLDDTNADGQADTRRIVLSGFGTEDTHHLLHTLRFGPDGRLYANQSVYIHSSIETPYGLRQLSGGGIWQYRPNTCELEVFCRGLYNPWGHVFDRWGQSFVSDGAGREGISYAFPGALLTAAAGANHTLEGLNPGSPKESGLEIIDSPHMPDAWQGSLLTSDFRAHRVCRYVLSDDGAGFSSREQPELVKSTHVAFRPIDIAQGPDGAIYIADWYNPIIQHGEVDFRDPRRDHTHGRIWRVTAKGRPLAERQKLSHATPAELCMALESPEGWTRHFARRQLAERGPSMAADLSQWIGRLNGQEPDYVQHLLEGLWAYQGIETIEPDLLSRVLTAPDGRIRAAAVRVLSDWQRDLPDVLGSLRSLAIDSHPRVRLEAVCALTRIGTPEAVQIALRALDRPRDRFLDHALYLSAHETQGLWLPAWQQQKIDFGGNAGHLAFALIAAESSAAVAPLADLIRSGKLPAEQSGSALSQLMKLGGPAELAIVFDSALAAAADADLCADLVAGLVKAARDRKLRPEGDLTRLAALFSVEDDGVRVAAVQAAGVWQLESLRPQLLQLGTAGDSPQAVRVAALDGLAALGGPASHESLVHLSGADRSAAVRAAAIAALVSFDVDEAARLAAALLTASGADFDPGPLLLTFVQRKKADTVVAALEGKKIPADTAKLALRALRDSGLPAEELIAAIEAAGGTKSGPTKLSPDELRALVEQVASQGDPARGEALFRRANCLKCHAIAGAGGLVGPDLISIGASAPIDYLVESLLDPSSKTKENYQSLLVTTDTGLVYSGIKIRQTDKELVLRDAEDRQIVIPLDSIDGQPKPGPSLMPTGLADSLTSAELVDLVRFLSELGKVGPYAVDKSRVVRRWQVLPVTPESFPIVKHDDVALVLASRHLPWIPAYSTVAGLLPAADVPVFNIVPGHTRGLVRFQLKATTPGRVDLNLPFEGLRSIWLDGVLLTPAARLPLDLTAGIHTLLLVLEPSRLADVRVELVDVPGSAVSVEIIGGK